MADTHIRDSSWETDLIWDYFHAMSTKADPRGEWYKNMDPLGQLSTRHFIYELLVDQADHTNPPTAAEVDKSLIPWNQNNADFLRTVHGQLWCGSIVKLVFTRYMGWTGVEPKYYPVTKKGFDAARWTIEKLRKKIPVRASLGGHHYVGIVGHRCVPQSLPAGVAGPAACSHDNDFLCLEPWAGGIEATASITYAGSTTSFLGIIEQRGARWKYSKELIIGVEV
jgi:hypothetical protein